jgi:hypothetical protein
MGYRPGTYLHIGPGTSLTDKTGRHLADPAPYLRGHGDDDPERSEVQAESIYTFESEKSVIAVAKPSSGLGGVLARIMAVF